MPPTNSASNLRQRWLWHYQLKGAQLDFGAEFWCRACQEKPVWTQIRDEASSYVGACSHATWPWAWYGVDNFEPCPEGWGVIERNRRGEAFWHPYATSLQMCSLEEVGFDATRIYHPT